MMPTGFTPIAKELRDTSYEIQDSVEVEAIIAESLKAITSKEACPT